MSGLAVLVRRDGAPADAAAVWAMLEAAPHRGPDGTWVHVDGPVGLGYAKLAVTPENLAARQPLISPLTGCVVVADARLDNRRELLAALRGDWLTGNEAELPDAALILRAYEVWGEESPVRLLGDFAFVVWDPRNRRVLCARDTSGQRPFCYRADHDGFAAASEIRQLVQDPSIPVEVNEDHLIEFLVPANLRVNEKDGSETYFQGIKNLPAGHALTLVADDAGGPRVRRYWSLEPPAEIRYRSVGEYAEHFRALFFEVVRARLRSAGPVGVMLSGGLDSSSVACVAQELRGGATAGDGGDGGLTAFSMVFDGLECDERYLVEEIRAKYDMRTVYVPAPEHIWGIALEPTEFLDSPLGRPDAREALFAAADEAGVRVLLAGDVADGCVRGSPLVFDSLLRHGRLREFRDRLAQHQRTTDESLRRVLALYCAAPLLPRWAQRELMVAWLRRTIPRDRQLVPAWMPAPLRAELRRRHLERSVGQEQERRFASPAREQDYRMLYPPEIARYPAGWHLDIWRPFADRRLHELLLAIPPEVKYVPQPETDDAYAAGKRLPREALRGLLPERIRTRTHQTHFAAVFERELEQSWPQLERVFGPGQGASSEIARRGYVEPAPFWERLQAVRAGARRRDFMYVLRLVEVEMWLRSLQLPPGTWIRKTGQSSIAGRPGTTQRQQFHYGSERIGA